MAEQQAARAGKKAGDGSGASTATMSTPIFDELLREMTASSARQEAEPAQQGAGRRAKATESRHRAAP